MDKAEISHKKKPQKISEAFHYNIFDRLSFVFSFLNFQTDGLS